MVAGSKDTNKTPIATKRDVAHWLSYLNLRKEDKFEEFCLCGCGQRIIPKTYHFSNKDRFRRIRYIRGHNTRGKKMVYSEEGLIGKKLSAQKLILWHKSHPEALLKNWEKTVRSWQGENHPLWLGGKSFEPYGLQFNRNLKRIIRNRDEFSCQLCFLNEKQLGKRLSIHHIDYDKQNNHYYNLISLCTNCHVKTNFNREYWQNYFTTKLLVTECLGIDYPFIFNLTNEMEVNQ